ncbi:MAG: HAD family hydrolase [Actinomycetota bacterium]|nr:HAD family hydrolase [Actinomycetota bacterium]
MRGVLFDLDGTLLDIDLEMFLAAYYRELVPVITTVVPSIASDAAIPALENSVRAMMVPHPGRTNEEAFQARFLEITGHDIHDDREPFDRFYAEVFPDLKGTAGPAAGARECVETALDLGLRVAVATNPIFPLAAIEHRLAWAGLDDLNVHAITSYESSCATKPHAEYYRETARRIEVDPLECLMVGDDRALDLAAADIGMRTFYVGSDENAVADYRGDLTQLTALLTQLARK